MSEQFHELQEFFRFSPLGVPSPKFSIRVADDDAQSILSPKHSLDIVAYLARLECEKAWLIEEGRGEVDAQRLFEHSSNLVAQAIYLDTADRNTWPGVQEMVRLQLTEGGFTSALELMKSYWLRLTGFCHFTGFVEPKFDQTHIMGVAA